ncbi:MAG: tetratricopeptide repeat protein [Chloracidobacterium sp.]|nr:tetratricopeptide repeat protein [Chloracidobacterium sp.]
MTRAVETLERLAAESPEDGVTQDAMWLTYWLAGNINEEIDNPRFYRFQEKAARMARDAVARDASDIRAKQRLAKSLSHLGQAANNIGRPAEALAHLEESSRLYQVIIETETRNGRLKADLAASLLRLANTKKKMGQLAPALDTFKQAVAIYVAVNGQFPNDKRTKNNLATAYGEVGKLYEANPAKFRNALRSAGENYRRALDLMLEMQAQQNILSEYDLEFLEEMRAAVEKFTA